MGDEILMKLYKIALLTSISCCVLFADNATQGRQNTEKTQEQIQSISAQTQNTAPQQPQPHIQEYDMMFDAINTPRKGLNENNMSKLSDPFLVQKTFISALDVNGSSDEGLNLHAIFNDRAKINSKWYKTGEKIGDYTLKKIKASSVMLVSKDQNLELNITKGRENVGIKIK